MQLSASAFPGQLSNNPWSLQLTNMARPCLSRLSSIVHNSGAWHDSKWAPRATICHWSQCLLSGEPGVSLAQLCIPGLLRAHPHRGQGTSLDTLGISLPPDTSSISCLNKCPIWHLRSLDWGPEDLCLSLCLLSEACHRRPPGDGWGCFLNWAGLESVKSTTQMGGMVTPGLGLSSAELP